MAGPTNQLGEAVITVRVDDSGVGPGMATAVQTAKAAAQTTVSSGTDWSSYDRRLNAETERAFQNQQRLAEEQSRAADVAVQAAEQVGQAVEVGIVRQFRKAVGVVNGFLGALGAVAGTATLFYNLGNAISAFIIDRLESGKKKATEFVESLDMAKPKESLGELQKKLSEIDQEIAGRSASGASWFEVMLFGKDSAGVGAARLKQLEEMKANLLKTQESVQGAVNATEQRAADDKKKLDEDSARAKIEIDRTAARAAADAEVIATLDGAEKVRAQAFVDIEELKRRRDAANDEEVRRHLQTAIDAREVRLQKELEAIRREAEEQTKRDNEQAQAEDRRREEQYQKELDAAERAADRVADAYRRAIQDARNSAAGLFDMSAVTQGIELVSAKLDAIARNTGRRDN